MNSTTEIVQLGLEDETAEEKTVPKKSRKKSGKSRKKRAKKRSNSSEDSDSDASASMNPAMLFAKLAQQGSSNPLTAMFMQRAMASAANSFQRQNQLSEPLFGQPSPLSFGQPPPSLQQPGPSTSNFAQIMPTPAFGSSGFVGNFYGQPPPHGHPGAFVASQPPPGYLPPGTVNQMAPFGSSAISVASSATFSGRAHSSQAQQSQSLDPHAMPEDAPGPSWDNVESGTSMLNFEQTSSSAQSSPAMSTMNQPEQRGSKSGTVQTNPAVDQSGEPISASQRRRKRRWDAVKKQKQAGRPEEIAGSGGNPDPANPDQPAKSYHEQTTARKRKLRRRLTAKKFALMQRGKFFKIREVLDDEIRRQEELKRKREQEKLAKMMLIPTVHVPPELREKFGHQECIIERPRQECDTATPKRNKEAPKEADGGEMDTGSGTKPGGRDSPESEPEYYL